MIFIILSMALLLFSVCCSRFHMDKSQRLLDPFQVTHHWNRSIFWSRWGVGMASIFLLTGVFQLIMQEII